MIPLKDDPDPIRKMHRIARAMARTVIKDEIKRRKVDPSTIPIEELNKCTLKLIAADPYYLDLARNDVEMNLI
jgi:hypothetical protein